VPYPIARWLLKLQAALKDGGVVLGDRQKLKRVTSTIMRANASATTDGSGSATASGHGSKGNDCGQTPGDSVGKARNKGKLQQQLKQKEGMEGSFARVRSGSSGSGGGSSSGTTGVWTAVAISASVIAAVVVALLLADGRATLLPTAIGGSRGSNPQPSQVLGGVPASEATPLEVIQPPTSVQSTTALLVEPAEQLGVFPELKAVSKPVDLQRDLGYREDVGDPLTAVSSTCLPNPRFNFVHRPAPARLHHLFDCTICSTAPSARLHPLRGALWCDRSDG
jgi:hypothetical protein